MMKKFMLFILAGIASINTAKGASFQGFYVGATAGYAQRTTTNTIITNVSADDGSSQTDINASAKNHINGFIYGLLAGYGQSMNGFYFGGEVTAHMDTADRSKKGIIPVINGQLLGFTFKYRRGLTFGIAPRIGVILAGTTMIYGKLGVEVSNDKTYFGFIIPDGTQGPIFIRSKTNVSFVPGIGVEKAFNNLLTRIEYNYNCGAKIKQINNVIDQSTTDQTLRYTAHTVKVGLVYQF